MNKLNKEQKEILNKFLSIKIPEIFYDEDCDESYDQDDLFDNTMIVGLAHSLLHSEKFAKKPPKQGLEEVLNEARKKIASENVEVLNYFSSLVKTLEVILKFY